MSRSGYTDDLDSTELNLYRGAVDRALGGKRGQQLLKELVEAMDKMPEKRLIAEKLVTPEGCCALGVVACARNLDISKVDPDAPEQVSKVFNIARSMAMEIVYINDECGPYGREETPEERWVRVYAWAKDLIKETVSEPV
jgi:hypothetical protein